LATGGVFVGCGAAGRDLVVAADDSAAVDSEIVKRCLHFTQVADLPTEAEGTLYFAWQCVQRVRIGTAEAQDVPEVRGGPQDQY
jgi:hypothetical protein